MTDTIETVIQAALSPLGYPVSQTPGDASAETWLTWNAAGASMLAAGNVGTRIRHLVQLHAWTHGSESEHRTAFFLAVSALRQAGVRVWRWGPDEYEKDTGISHIACTCTYNETVKETDR